LKTICVPEARCRVLGKDHTKIKTGVYEYCKEEGKRIELCEWFAIDAFDELKMKIESYINSIDNFHPSMIEYIHSVYGGDHGQGKFRFPSKLIIKCKGSNEPFTRTYLLAEIDCKKDNGEIIKSTIAPEIQSGTDKVLTRSFKFSRAHVKNKWVWVGS
jgi:hypothetical protein